MHLSCHQQLALPHSGACDGIITELTALSLIIFVGPVVLALLLSVWRAGSRRTRQEEANVPKPVPGAGRATLEHAPGRDGVSAVRL